MTRDDAFELRPRPGRIRERGRLYGAETDASDGRAFTERGREDRHQFRFIVAPEDGDRLSDLRTFTTSTPATRTVTSSSGAAMIRARTSSSPRTTSPTGCG